MMDRCFLGMRKGCLEEVIGWTIMVMIINTESGRTHIIVVPLLATMVPLTIHITPIHHTIDTHPPISTYNRYSPLRDHYNENVCPFPSAGYDPSPYKQPYLDPRATRDFREDSLNKKRGPETREGPEEGGGYRDEKRKRT